MSNICTNSMDDKVQSDLSDLEMSDEDIWDDSLLIKAYDKAISIAKSKVNANLDKEKEKESPETPKNASKKTESYHCKKENTDWCVGMPCRAVYSADGLEYEADIKHISNKSGKCQVVYVGYNNSEEVDLASLKPSNGPKARTDQTKKSSKTDYSDYNDGSSHRKMNFNNVPNFIPPPPPPHVMAHFPENESDALSAMLMSWYMSGFHTGYYQGISRCSRTHNHGHYNGMNS